VWLAPEAGHSGAIGRRGAEGAGRYRKQLQEASLSAGTRSTKGAGTDQKAPMSAGSREDADSTAPDLQHDWCSECEHQYTAVAGIIKGEGTYLLGG
jgi:hypothetical protein